MAQDAAIQQQQIRMSSLIGQQINQYRVDALLGEGNMGSVFQAFDLHLARKVVLKVMHSQLAKQPQFQQRFLQEAQAAARLDHPSIVKIHNFATEPRLYIVMEHIAGPSLGEYVNRRWEQQQEPALTEVLRLVAQVASALDYAHEQGVIHRDIKPSNILLKPLTRPDREGDPALRAVVTDFGLAKLREGDVHTLTGTFMGTLSYMSPEQCMARPLDGRSDIYSLGIVLYQLTTGQLPFDIKSPTDAIRMHVKELPPAPTLVRPDLPEAVERIIVQAIAKNPANRFQTGNQLAIALRRVAQMLDNPGGTYIQLPPAQDGQTSLRPPVNEWEVLAAGVPAHVDRLVILREGEIPRVIGLEQSAMLIGRNPDNDIVLNEKGVSRQHVRLERNSHGWSVTDLSSTNGTYLDAERLTPETPYAWQPEAELRIGAYLLQWQSAQSAMGRAQQAMLGLEPSTDVRYRTDPGEVELVVNPTKVELEAGDRVNLQVMLVNRGPIVEHVHMRLDGLPADWVTMSDELVQLMPGARGFVRISIHLPRSSEATSGQHEFIIIATPMSNLEATANRVCELVVRPFVEYSAELQPPLLRNGGLCQIFIHNQGNAEAHFTITSDESNRLVTYSEQAWQLKLLPGQRSGVEFLVTPRRRPGLGFTKLLPYGVQVENSQGQQRALTGQLEALPHVPGWALTTASVIILVMGFILLLALVLRS